ncbi:MAG TPA: hypothetical protein VLC48_01320 [Gemmatimonadota bacterium]|nr:hypothetical protein [Gemmatimonadota bacterium]
MAHGKRSTSKKILLGLVLLVLGVTSFMGFLDATENMRAADTFLKKISNTAQLTYVIFGAVSILVILAKQRNAAWPLIAWAAAITATAALSTHVWGGAGLGTSLAAGAAAAAAAGLVVWAGVYLARP